MHAQSAQSRLEPLINVAQRALMALRGTVEEKSDQSAIETDVRSLRGVATVIEGLCTEVVKCGGEGCMGRAIDGIRLWVADDQYQQAKARAIEAEARAERLEAALRNIAEADAAALPEVAMFWDWQAAAQCLQQTARNALSGV
jgi:hypothetical protein